MAQITVATSLPNIREILKDSIELPKKDPDQKSEMGVSRFRTCRAAAKKIARPEHINEARHAQTGSSCMLLK